MIIMPFFVNPCSVSKGL